MMKLTMKTTLKSTLLVSLMAAASQVNAAGEAKNVIFFLGDGMGPTTVTASRIYKYGESGKLTLESLRRTARIKTYSNDAQTTDSAPSMSAYMTGVKMNNEVLSMSPDTKAFDAAGKPFTDGSNTTCLSSNGTPVTTMLELAKANGKAVGAVTTTRITHATPAATYSHICNRDGENDIAAQVVPGNPRYNAKLGTGVDVLLGGGYRHFIPSTATGSKRKDDQDLLAQLAAKGYTVVNSKTAFNTVDASKTSKLVGLFNKDHLNYDLDREKNPAIDEPTLADMTTKAIDILSKNNKGYFLMVEGGRIDHALHDTNAKRALHDTIAFDNAIKAALGKVDLSNTLIVVTADHDHTMAFNGYSHRGNNILGLTTQYQDKKLAKDVNGLPYTTLVFGNGGGERNDTRSDLTNVDTLDDNYLQQVGVKLGDKGSETHGGGDVFLFSSGAGSTGFKGTLDNTKVFGVVKTAFGF